MNNSADDNKKELMDEYKTTSKRLQNYVIIFLGFLFLIFFLILFPYYFLTDSYKLAQNMKFYSDKIYENFDLNRHILQHYKQYNEGTKKLLNNVTTYTNILEKVKQLYNDTQYNNGTDFSFLKKNIEHEIKYNTFDLCFQLPKPQFHTWKICNINEYRTELKKNASIMIDTSTFNKFENIADQIDSYLENLRSLNVNKDLSVSDYLKKRDVKIKQLSDWTDAIHRISFSNKEANTSIFAAEKLFIEQYYGWEGLYDEQITNEIKKKIQNLIAKVESLEFPIIGKVFTDIDYVLLSTPLIILIGFSILCIDFKKIITIRKRLESIYAKNRNNNKFYDEYKEFLSWLDILQPWKENIHAILTILTPFALYIIFLILIYNMWFANLDFRNAGTFSFEESFKIPQYKELYLFFSVLGIGIFVLYYIVIYKNATKEIEINR